MSHFAKIESGIVTQVIVAEQDFVDTQSGTWVQKATTRMAVNIAKAAHHYVKTMLVLVTRMTVPVMLFIRQNLMQVGH